MLLGIFWIMLGLRILDHVHRFSNWFSGVTQNVIIITSVV